MSFNNHSFCPEAWSQILIDSQGDYKICCLSCYGEDRGVALDINNNVLNVLTHSFDEAINSETHKKHRLEMQNNIRPIRCKSCWDADDYANKNSKRWTVLNDLCNSIPEYVNLNTAEKYTNTDGTITSKIVNLDLRFGNLCNQKCIMCGPQNSNQWYDDWIALNFNKTGNISLKKGRWINDEGNVGKNFLFKKDDHGRNKLQFTPWWETDIWWNRFDEISPNLRHLYFTGGEPLLVPAMKECLTRLIDKGYSNDIELRYDTNFSVINSNLFDLWKKFKKIVLCVSIDETYDRYNLIRNPGKFEVLINNLLEARRRNIKIFYLSSCIGIATPYSMIRTLEFADIFKLNSFYRFLDGPSWLDIRHFPKAAKNEIISKLKSVCDTCPKHHIKYYQSEINLLQNYIDQEDRNSLREFIRVMDILDIQRNLDWKKTLPDVHDLLMNYSDLDKQ